MGQYLTAPVPSKKMPGGIPYIIGNEAAERFSFYGMKGILTVFMTKHLLDAAGQPDYMSDEEAKTVYHLFTAAAYFFPIIGSLFSDIIWGKYRTIIILSLGYCIGHACLALGDTGIGGAVMEPRMWLFVGLIFISIGAGGIKPCVSAHVGDQFGTQNQHLVSKIFSWFYFSINVGAALSTLLTPVLLVRVGPWMAFGLPGVLMGIATFVFWLGRNKFVHIPPGGTKFATETLSPDGRRALLHLSPIFLIFIPMFWAIFDQSGSAWVLQADRMDRHFMGLHWLPSQIQAVNPILILILIPTFAYGVYPLIDKFVRVTPLRKISAGLFLTVVAFSASGLIEENITGGEVSEASSVSPVEGWNRQAILDGPADGLGWSSSPNDDLPHEIVVRLRERDRWSINAVEIDPFTIVGDADGDDDAQEQRDAMADAEQTAAHDAPDPANWARNVTILVRDADQDTDGEAYVEVATVELAQEAGRQRFEFAAAQATHVKIRVNSNWGGDRAKIGELRVMQASAAPPAADDVAAIGFMPNIGWQFLAYVLLTAAEVLVSITSLEFAYTQAPKRMKSFIMGVYFLGVSLGNVFTAGVNFFIQNDDGSVKLEGADYYWFFTGVMLLTAIVFVFFATRYKGSTFVQGDDPDPSKRPGRTGAPLEPERPGENTFGADLQE